MKIFVKSNPEFFDKERIGYKPNTIRWIDGHDTITVENAVTGEKFEREIEDISVYKDAIIISWKQKEAKKS